MPKRNKVVSGSDLTCKNRRRIIGAANNSDVSETSICLPTGLKRRPVCATLGGDAAAMHSDDGEGDENSEKRKCDPKANSGVIPPKAWR